MKKMKVEEKKIVHSLIFSYEEAAIIGVLEEKVFLKISINSQEKHSCWNVSFLIKLQP